MRITFVLPFINLTGGVRVLLDYANWLHDAGHDTTVVYPCWPYQFQYSRRQQWGEFVRHRRHDGTVSWFGLRSRLLRVPLVRTMFLPPADLVIATAWPTVFEVASLHRSRGKKIHIVMHHESGTGPEEIIQEIYQLPFHRIAFSQFVRDSIQDRFGCPIRAVVPNGVDPTLFFPDGDVTPRSVLFLYHPDPRKGAEDGLDALCWLRERMPDVTVRVCGTVRPERLPAWMDFEFHPDDEKLRKRYSTSAVLLYPSRYEGFGLPPLEAMACGCPSVTTPVGAVPEFATDRHNSLIVPVGRPDLMVDRLEEILGDPPLRARLSQAALHTAERWSLAKVAPLFEVALEEARRL